MAAIELVGLTKDYGEVLAVDDVTFSVEEGEIFGYLGPNGAGKTTTIRTILGLLSPTAGSARVLGHDVADERELIEAKRRIGYLPDNPQFDEGATGREILELHADVKGDVRSDELVELFDPPLDRPVREYSHGNVRKLGLVTTFMHEPDLVILDEPTGGLDPLMKQRFTEFVRRERERGLTVFFSSHVLGEVRRLCDRVGIIRAGRLVTVEPIESLLHRSGKVVRIAAAEPIPRSRFDDLDGAHDIRTGTTSTSAERDDGLGEGAPPEGEGVHREAEEAPREADESRGASNPDEQAFAEYTFTYVGEVTALVEALTGYRLLDLTIEEAPLEDVFLRFYGEDAVVSSGADDGPAATTTHAEEVS